MACAVALSPARVSASTAQGASSAAHDHTPFPATTAHAARACSAAASSSWRARARRIKAPAAVAASGTGRLSVPLVPRWDSQEAASPQSPWARASRPRTMYASEAMPGMSAVVATKSSHRLAKPGHCPVHQAWSARTACAAPQASSPHRALARRPGGRVLRSRGPAGTGALSSGTGTSSASRPTAVREQGVPQDGRSPRPPSPAPAPPARGAADEVRPRPPGGRLPPATGPGCAGARPPATARRRFRSATTDRSSPPPRPGRPLPGAGGSFPLRRRLRRTAAAVRHASGPGCAPGATQRAHTSRSRRHPRSPSSGQPGPPRPAPHQSLVSATGAPETEPSPRHALGTNRVPGAGSPVRAGSGSGTVPRR